MEINTNKIQKRKLKVDNRIAEIQKQLSEISTDYSNPKYISLTKELANLQSELRQLSELEELLDQYSQAKDLTTNNNDQELSALASQEVQEIEPKIEALYNSIFNPKPDVDNFVLEIRAGAGGEEAALFARDIFRMYSIFLQEIGASLEISDTSYSEQGGYKFISAYIKGPNAYYWFQYESGVHRVQRVPVTESSGRIHTSTVSVAILPEYKDAPEITLHPNDLEITPIKASGPGGQHVNKNLTAVRIKHIPTGTIVSSQRYKSQKQNRDFALKLIKLKLAQEQKQKEESKLSDLRKQQIGTMDRSEKIRTYNFPQSRMTDHRIKRSWHNLDEIMNGKIKDILEEIITEMQKLQESKE